MEDIRRNFNKINFFHFVKLTGNVWGLLLTLAQDPVVAVFEPGTSRQQSKHCNLCTLYSIQKMFFLNSIIFENNLRFVEK